MNHGFISGKDKRFPCPYSVQAIFGVRPAAYSVTTQGFSPGGKVVRVWSWSLTSI